MLSARESFFAGRGAGARGPPTRFRRDYDSLQPPVANNSDGDFKQSKEQQQLLCGTTNLMEDEDVTRRMR